MPETALMMEEPDMSDFDFGDSSALRTQFSGANIPFYFSRGFDDLKESIAITPESLKQNLGITRLVLSGGTESTVFPEELKLEMGSGTVLWVHDGALEKDVTGWDAFIAGRPDNLSAWGKAKLAGLFSIAAAINNKTITLQKDNDNCSVDRCAYKVADPESTYSLFSFSGTHRLLSFIGPDGNDDPKASVNFVGWYTVHTSLDTNLKATLTFGAPAADMTF